MRFIKRACVSQRKPSVKIHTNNKYMVLPSVHRTDLLRLLPRTQLHTITYSFLPFIWGKRPTGEATLHLFFSCLSSHLNRTLG